MRVVSRLVGQVAHTLGYESVRRAAVMSDRVLPNGGFQQAWLSSTCTTLSIPTKPPPPPPHPSGGPLGAVPLLAVIVVFLVSSRLDTSLCGLCCKGRRVYFFVFDTFLFIGSRFPLAVGLLVCLRYNSISAVSVVFNFVLFRWRWMHPGSGCHKHD